MCVVCYIATDKELEEIPFNKELPSFHVEKEEQVTFHPQTFTEGMQIYYVGSSERCGCGFTSNVIPPKVIDHARKLIKKGDEFPWQYWEYFQGADTSEELEEVISMNQKEWSDTQKLYDLLVSIVNDCGKAECFVCWSGKEEEPLDDSIEVCISTEAIGINFCDAWDKNIKFNVIS